jgi:hypothetical protein
MSKGVQLVIVSLVALTFMLAFCIGLYGGVLFDSHPERFQSYSDIREEDGRPTPAIKLAAEPPQEHTPCLDMESRDESDLCAAWRATAAAEWSSRWAWWQLLFSGLGILGLVATVFQGQKALRNAVEANRIPRDIMIMENRAWLSFEATPDPSFNVQWDDHGSGIGLQVVAKNTGATVALEVQYHAVFYFKDDIDVYIRLVANGMMHVPKSIVVFPTERETIKGELQIIVHTPGWVPEGKDSDPKLLVWLSYRTIFDEPNQPARVTLKCYEVATQLHHCLRKQDCPIPNDRIMLRRVDHVGGIAT